MVVLVTCKNEEDPVKVKVLECLKYFNHYKSMGFFSETQGHITSQSLVRPDRMLISYEICLVVLVTYTCKNEEDRIKNEGARVIEKQ